MSETNNATRPAFAPTGPGWYTLRDGRTVEIEAVGNTSQTWQQVGSREIGWFASGCFSIDGRFVYLDIVAPWVPKVGDTVRVARAKPEWSYWDSEMDGCVGATGLVECVYEAHELPCVDVLGWCFPIECLAPVESESRPSDADTIAELREQIDRLREQLAEATSPVGVAEAATELSRKGRLEWKWSDNASELWFKSTVANRAYLAFRPAMATTVTTYRGTPAQHEAAKAAGLEEVPQ